MPAAQAAIPEVDLNAAADDIFMLAGRWGEANRDKRDARQAPRVQRGREPFAVGSMYRVQRLLGIELETRGRVRVNGNVEWVNEHGFELHVEQAFGNCRKYIHARTRGAERPPSPASELPVLGGALLSPPALRLLDRSGFSAPIRIW